MTLADDDERCSGVGFPDEDTGKTDWREGCEDCARRLAPMNDPNCDASMIMPPAIIVFECEYRIPMEQP